MQRIFLIVLGFSLIANVLLFIFITKMTTPADNLTKKSPQEFPYVSPRLFVERKNDVIINFVKLRTQLQAYVKKEALDATPERLGINFEYLPSGISIGINETQPYVAASLLKVPIIMGIYKNIESGKIKEDTVLTLKKEDLDPNYGDLWKRGVGATISVDEAIRMALIQSDNTAKSVLFSYMPMETLDDVFRYLDITNEVSGDIPVVTTKNYSSILRSLYLSNYLSIEYSNKILSRLTETDFTDKIAAGIPRSVKVAHKIGVHDIHNPNGSIYTDCGIVYVPKRPYILCMMMRVPESDAQKHMSEISKIIYEYVSTANQP